MIHVVVLADTHMPRRMRKLPVEVCKELERADAIVHLGDFTDLAVARDLIAMAPLHAVHGNNDGEEVRAAFPSRQVIDVAGHRLVLIHGDRGGRTALSAARGVGDGEAVLFGHSHTPYCAVEGGRLLFNPGSPTDKRRGPYASFGIIDIGEQLDARIVPLRNDR